MTHDHGSLYHDWRKSEIRITELERELEREQVRHVDLADYQIGAPHYERLMEQLSLAQQFQWPSLADCNV